jgi:hypothetical protein
MICAITNPLLLLVIRSVGCPEVAPRQDSQSAEALTSRFSFDMCSKRLMATSVSKTAHLIAYVCSPITESPLAKRSQNARLVGPIVQMAHQ